MNIAGLSVEELMDWLKSLANMCKVLFGLFGTYEMFDLLDLSDQLMRRSKIIHLRRYSRSAEDFIDFQQTILSFQQNLPFAKQPDLLAHSDYLYERTAGCVGNLYDWLLSALHIALHDSTSDTLKYKHLRASVPFTAFQAAKMDESIEEDEGTFFKKIGEDDDDNDDDNDVGNKNSQKAALQEHSIRSNLSYDNNVNSPASKSQGRRKVPVGKRLPKRDQTGINREHNA